MVTGTCDPSKSRVRHHYGKSKFIFMQFYTQYILNLSISKYLLVKAVNYAKQLVGIGEKEGKRIIHSQKSFLLNNLDIWVKKVGDQDNGLCKDNGLGHFENIGGPRAELYGGMLLIYSKEIFN